MRKFNYKKIYSDLLTPEIVQLLAQIHEHKGAYAKVRKAELAQCPDISQTTIQRTLNDIVKSGEVIKIGGGRYTSYTWNRERD